ncbi:hypothetical protein QQ008_15240 [Fulvivirgaceae bacterium BMA10]|uniref:Uncharacterized protein n=1 Tax=Splendidivirga corallicola TaxID=3051826 RepID=A0ABT8KRW1_9BACT|nr:hypothetical protein [Fulvivirgaceae bacterium BMA10]
MQNHLHFVCPTDYLEPIINNSFKHRNYYYTSLGNSVVFNDKIINQIEGLIKKNNIRKISFVLSNDNRIVLDALGNHDFPEITGLNNFHYEITRQKECSEMLWQTCNRQFSILSYYLNKKIKELELELSNLSIDQIKISGKIYNKQESIFSDIYSDLICREYFSLN